MGNPESGSFCSGLVKVVSAETSVLAMEQSHVAVANPVHPAAEMADGFHLDDQMPVIAHPWENLELRTGRRF
jgi:hypothetical protein